MAIAEAAQNIVKHAYQNEETQDKMEIRISLKDNELESLEKVLNSLDIKFTLTFFKKNILLFSSF